ncbi:MAG: hypothetical protein CFE24_01490 [Flavobacterium sp. BFFFF2]|nr:MAG: hypothetical protein CFE24_01490 [Flavobacterium sp. BFFFF2]
MSLFKTYRFFALVCLIGFSCSVYAGRGVPPAPLPPPPPGTLPLDGAWMVFGLLIAGVLLYKKRIKFV